MSNVTGDYQSLNKPQLTILRTNALQIAKLRTLVEQNFPTQELRCKSGRPQDYAKQCIVNNNLLSAFSKENI